MRNLDLTEEIKKLDSGNIIDSIRMLPAQIEDTWNKFKELKIPSAYSQVENIVIAGMGGSALGGRIIDSLIVDRARVPIEVFTEYHIPAYVGKDTLVVVSSYSGGTEETIADLAEAVKKGAQVFGFTTGGKLAELLKEDNLSAFIFKPDKNPSKQPRMALGYSIAGILALLSKCGFIHLTDEEVAEIVNTTKEFILEFDVDVPTERNLAKLLTHKLKNKIPVLVASEHLLGSSHAFKNQINENAKTFSVLFDIPELNHHLMEGLKNPAQARELLHFLFIESDFYSPRVRARYPITKEVVEKNEVEFEVYKLRSSEKILQIFEALVFGSFVSFYLAMLYDIDPTPIPWVDYFKKKLSGF